MASKAQDQQPVTLTELSVLRTEMLETLRLFHVHVKYVITLIVTWIGFAAIVASYGVVKLPELGQQLLALGSGALVLLLPVAFIATNLVRRYYVIYASQYVYLAWHQDRAGDVHPWTAILRQEIDGPLVEAPAPDEDIERVRERARQAVTAFMDRKHGSPHSWHWYRFLILGLGSMSAALGLLGIAYSAILALE